MHKRETQNSDASPDPDPEEVLTKKVVHVEHSKGLPARDRASEKIVHRATQGLMRRESRRRLRLFVRRTIIGSVVAIIGWLLWRIFSDQLPAELLSQYWEELKDKILPVLFPDDLPEG